MTNKPDATNAGYQNTIVQGLVDGGYWTRMDLFYVFAIHNNDANEALINWTDPGTNDADNPTATAWTIWRGYQGNGSNDYISTNFIPSSEGSNFTLNDCAVGIYLLDNINETNKAIWSANDATNASRLFIAGGGGATSAVLNSALGTSISVNQARSDGFYIVSRNANNSIYIYINGADVAHDTDASAALNTNEFNIFRNPGTGSAFSANEAAIFFVMDSVTEEEATAINTIIETYMDAIGTGVQ